MFVSSSKKLSIMDIVNAAKFCGLSLEKGNQIESAELLRQKISSAISRNISLKMRSNLTFEQRTVLK